MFRCSSLPCQRCFSSYAWSKHKALDGAGFPTVAPAAVALRPRLLPNYCSLARRPTAPPRWLRAKLTPACSMAGRWPSLHAPAGAVRVQVAGHPTEPSRHTQRPPRAQLAREAAASCRRSHKARRTALPRPAIAPRAARMPAADHSTNLRDTVASCKAGHWPSRHEPARAARAQAAAHATESEGT